MPWSANWRMGRLRARTASFTVARHPGSRVERLVFQTLFA